MRSIAMLNQKGGVGKTTTAVNVAAGLARLGRSVLLVDLDPQAHASQHLGIEVTDGWPSIYDVLVNGTPMAEASYPAEERLVVVPSHIDLVAAEVELTDREDREHALARALAPHRDQYDVLVIDCPPSLGLLAINALAAVSEVFIPLQPHFFALQGLGKLLETVMHVRELLNPDLRVTGVPVCMFERNTRLAQEVTGDVSDFLAEADPSDAWYGARVFKTRVRRNIKLAESPSFGKSIFDYAPNSRGAEDYTRLAQEIVVMETGDSPPENISESDEADTDEDVIRTETVDADDITDPDEFPPDVSAPLDQNQPSPIEVPAPPAEEAAINNCGTGVPAGDLPNNCGTPDTPGSAAGDWQAESPSQNAEAEPPNL